MGKKRIIKKRGGSDVSGTSRALTRIPKKKVASGRLSIIATFNNTILTLADGKKDTAVTVKGVGAGRESAIRAFAGKGINITSITDMTPVPHNGPRVKKARRV